MFLSCLAHESEKVPSFRCNGGILEESQQQISTVVMWSKEQSDTRFLKSFSIPLFFNTQRAQNLSDGKFPCVSQYETAIVLQR